MTTTINVSSLPGIHQNSNLSTGGGTDDTAVIQAALNGSYPGGLILIQDGVSLIAGLNVGSNTTIQCQTNCGFYLADNSNRSMVRNTNRSGTVVNSNYNITINGGTYNQNITNQTYGPGHLETDGTPMSALQFYGIKNLLVENVTVTNVVYAGVGCGTCDGVTVTNCSFSAINPASLNTSGVDLRGPATNVVLTGLTIYSGDDAIAANSINYQGDVNVGPYILGGSISNLVISNIAFSASWSGIDLLSNGANGYSVTDVYISNLSGTVENFALYLNRDPGDAPDGTGIFGNIFISGSTVTQTGSPFGPPIPPGLWIIDGITSVVYFSNFGSAELISLPTTNANVTSLVLNGQQRGPLTGITSVSVDIGLYAQSVTTLAFTVSSVSKAFTNHITAGTFLLAFVFGFLSGGGATVSSISDTAGNTWTPLGSFSDGVTGHVGEVWGSENISNSTDTVTVNFSTTVTAAGLLIAEYGTGGMDFPSNPDLHSALTISPSVTTVDCPTLTTTGTHEMIIGLGSCGGDTITPVAPYTARESGGANLCVLIDDINVAPGDQTPAWTQAANGSYNFSVVLQTSATQKGGSISGNVGVAGASVSYGAGSVISDVNGNFLITGLANGTYTIVPTLSGYTFIANPFAGNPTQTINNTDATAIIFGASKTTMGTNWSPVDCRDYGIFPNTGVVQPSGAVFYTGQTSSNAAVPGVDSRETGAPVDSREIIPQNSRTAPPF